MKKLMMVVVVVCIVVFSACSNCKEGADGKCITNFSDINLPDADETTDEITDETIDETTDETIDETVDETTDETIDETVDETTDETTDETIDETVDETTDEATDETVDETPDEDDVVTIPNGHEGGLCFENKTCVGSLTCVEVTGTYICIDLTTDETPDETSDEAIDETPDEDDVVTIPNGHEGGLCFENKTCVGSLTCVDVAGTYTCVDLTDPDEGKEGHDCFMDGTCFIGLKCFKAEPDSRGFCVDEELGEEGEECLPNKSCNPGFTCDQASQNIVDFCVKTVNEVGTLNGSCRSDRSCNTGLTCFREDFLCLPNPITGARTICWSRELNVTPSQDSCSAVGGYAFPAFEYVAGVKTPDCEGVFNIDPELECVRTNATVEEFRALSPAGRTGVSLTSSFYLPVIN